MEKRGGCALTSRIKKNICPTSKRAQVTIFIIIAIVIVALGVTAYFLFPKIQSALGRGVTNPEEFIQTCLEEEIEDAVELVSLQGGSIEPEFYVFHGGSRIEYLCYTNENFQYCVMQQPMLIPHIEDEIKEYIEDDVEICFNALKESYEDKGYDVNMQSGSTNVELLPQRVVSTFDYTLTLTKEDSERHESFIVVVNNNLYELVSIANSILGWEALHGTADPIKYMSLYNYLKVEMDVPSDDTHIYILTDKRTEDKFQFASRSLAYPPLI